MVSRGLISIVTPVYNEERNIPLFYQRLCDVLHKLPYNFEVIFVDDGSRDSSALQMSKLKAIRNVTPRPLQFSRNFGKETAVTAGIHVTEGDAAIILDSDLQHPVEKIPEFIDKWKKGADVVIGVRGEAGKASIVKDIGSRVFYYVINKISETDIIPHSTDFRLIDRAVINEFNRFTERHRITRGLIDWLGFNRDTVMFDANKREFGVASYSMGRLIGLAVSSFVSHSVFPLRAVGILGGILTLFSGMAGLFVLIEQFLMKDPLRLAISGTAMVTMVVLFVCGIMLISLGVISLYVGMMHGESLNRPLYVLRQRQRE